MHYLFDTPSTNTAYLGDISVEETAVDMNKFVESPAADFFNGKLLEVVPLEPWFTIEGLSM